MKGARVQLRRKNPSAPKRTKSLKTEVPSIFSHTEFFGKELPLVYKPKVIKKLDECAYICHCTVKGGSGTTFNRNMVVLVDAEQHLTLVNPLRLTHEGEEKLMELGPAGIINIVRLGYSEHSPYEDDYYMKKYPDIQRWAPGQFSPCPDLPIHHRLWDTTYTTVPSLDAPIKPAVPISGCDIFCFNETAEPEAALILQNKRALIVGDCLQYQVANPFVNEQGQKNLEELGLLQSTVVISPPWLKMQSVVSNNSRIMNDSCSNRRMKNEAFFSSTGKSNLRKDFVRLIRLKASRLVSTSGNQVFHEDINAAITKAVEQACLMI